MEAIPHIAGIVTPSESWMESSEKWKEGVCGDVVDTYVSKLYKALKTRLE